MTARQSSPRIECPIALFEGCETEIERLTAAVNHASAPEEKSRMAKELLTNLSVLLGCDTYDESNFNCRHLSTLRHKTASVIGKAAALGR